MSETGEVNVITWLVVHICILKIMMTSWDASPGAVYILF